MLRNTLVRIFLFIALIVLSTSCSSTCPVYDLPSVEAKPNSLTGVWIAKRLPFRGESGIGCKVDSSTRVYLNGQDVQQGYELVIQQLGNSLILPPIEVEGEENKGKFCTLGSGSVKGSQVEFSYSGGQFNIEASGIINNNWNEVSGEMSCKFSSGNHIGKTRFLMIKKTSEIPNNDKIRIKELTNGLYKGFNSLLKRSFGWTCRFGNGLIIAGFGLSLVFTTFVFSNFAIDEHDEANTNETFFSKWQYILKNITIRYNSFDETNFFLPLVLGIGIALTKTHVSGWLSWLLWIPIFMYNLILILYVGWGLGVIFVYLISWIFTSRFILAKIIYIIGVIILGVYCVIKGIFLCG